MGTRKRIYSGTFLYIYEIQHCLITYLMKYIFKGIILFLFVWFQTSCSTTGEIETISMSAPDRNTLKVQIDVKTKDKTDAWIEYWQKGDSLKLFISPVSTQSNGHRLVLTNLRPKKEYDYRIVTKQEGKETKSKSYSFSTPGYPMWIQDFFKVTAPDSSVIPKVFKEGYVLISRRETPGIIFILDYKGDIRWYHQVNGTGFKTVHFTQNKTLLSILGTEEYPTSYGNEILEISMTGDTLLHLKKGEKDFKETIHHEIILNDQNQIVTLSVQKKIFDLSKVGGAKQDTVKSDGILVLDRQGKKVWSWSVFDELNPIDDKKILEEKKDWMHANSVSFDKDGNYLISFYNNGQIWKLDAKSGKVIWKFGRGGDFAISREGIFDQGHAVHRTSSGELMLFDNGTSKQLSRTLAFKLDETTKKSELTTNINLPVSIYTARMGSAYQIDRDAVLHCSSKTNTVVLTNKAGRFLWMLKSSIMPYRAEFIKGDQLLPYIVN
jgi:arylsulfate sulfotransferase